MDFRYHNTAMFGLVIAAFGVFGVNACKYTKECILLWICVALSFSKMQLDTRKLKLLV